MEGFENKVVHLLRTLQVVGSGVFFCVLKFFTYLIFRLEFKNISKLSKKILYIL